MNSFIINRLPPFNDNIPYTSLKKGAVLGKGSFAVAYVAYVLIDTEYNTIVNGKERRLQ